ncbi:MAG: ribonuclease III [Pseudomonadota bacterium]|nr:ribonuclease III [Pseudomonadota bacterium]
MRTQLKHTPVDAALFRAALTHRSASGTNNERLEFLGDSVLNLVVARHLYAHFAQADEGDLSRLRARLVSAEPLGEVAGRLGIGAALQLGPGELKSGGFRRQSILADAFEALCGALFLDAGLEAAAEFILAALAAHIEALPPPAALKDPKTRLQEYLQSRGLALPHYAVERIEGEPHDQTFEVSCAVEDLSLCTRGRGSSRRRAEQEAAERILDKIGQHADE